MDVQSSNLQLLGETINKERERLRCTLREFAKLTGVSYSQLSKIERGEHRPTRETLAKIEKVLKIDVALLYQLAGYSAPNSVQEFQTMIKESESEYEKNNWDHFITKMESMKLGPKELEEIVMKYEQIKTIILTH